MSTPHDLIFTYFPSHPKGSWRSFCNLPIFANICHTGIDLSLDSVWIFVPIPSGSASGKFTDSL